MANEAAALSAIDPIEDLIRRGSHREAAARCARLHGAAVGRLCMAMLGSQPEVEDALQETLLAAYHAMGAYRGDGSVRAWLFGIARRVCARRLEARSGEERRLRLVPGPTGDAGADLLLEARQRAEVMRRLLGRLKPSERDALLLRYESELSFREIGEACGVDEAAARKRASRGLLHLRELLQQQDGDER